MIYDDINNLYLDILKKLVEDGQLKGKRRELAFLTFSLTNLDKNILFSPFAQRNWPWILREASDRIFGVENPGTSFRYSKNWENRIEDSGYYSYHYANRLNVQMKELLSKKIQGRDKIVHVWNKDDINLKGRQPCTIIMQPVMEHDDKLSLVVYMRNNDMINIFPSDVFIHSTYFKYWSTYFGYEYKNLYWVATVAYYQKKRDVLQFPQRLLAEWDKDYQSFTETKWDKSLLTELSFKEELEQSARLGSLGSNLIDEIGAFSVPYAQEWYMIMLLAEFKAAGKKDEFKEVFSRTWHTEFNFIKDSITPPK